MKTSMKWGLVVLASTMLSVAQAGVLYLGTVSLKDHQDRDSLQLGPCAVTFNRPVEAIQLKVAHYPAEIDRLVVEYQNGQRDELFVKEHFEVGDSSRWIDLEGGKRCIKRITVVGDSDTFRYAPFKQAKVSFFGRD
jgi:hypothetical protein